MFKKITMFMLQMFGEDTPVANPFGDNSTKSAGMKFEVDQVFWNTALVKLASPKLLHDRWAQKVDIPAGNGNNIEFRKVANLNTDIDKNILTEGIPGNGQAMVVTKINAQTKQYGNYIKNTDLLEMTAKDDIAKLSTEACATQMATISDKVTREFMVNGCGGQFTANGLADLSHVEDKDSSGNLLAIMQGDDLFKAAARLKGNDAPMIDGAYVAIMHPYVAKDFMSKLGGNTAWMDAASYASPEDIMAGELGKYGGVRVFQSTLAKAYAPGSLTIAPDTKNETETVFATMVFGANAYGTTKLENGGAELIHHGKHEIGGPLDQYSTVGWKQTKTAEVLVPEYMVKIYSTATLGSIITADN